MPAERVYRVTDAPSGLECALTLFSAADGGVSAVEVELRNASDERDVVLKVNSEMSAFIMLTVTDDRGTVLSVPARKFDHSEVQTFAIERITRGSARRWRVPLASQLEARAIPEHGLKGRLVVNVGLQFARLAHGEEADDAGYQRSVVTLSDMSVTLTRGGVTG